MSLPHDMIAWKAAAEIAQEQCIALTARVRELEAALKVARDYVYDYGSEASMAPVVARIDAALSRATGSQP